MLAEEVTIIVTDLITREETVLAIAVADLRASSLSSTRPAELSELRAAKHNLFKLSQIPAALWAFIFNIFSNFNTFLDHVNS